MDDRSYSTSLYRERINRALDYINNRLDGKILLEDVARAAFFSPYHFHRIFTGLIGETPDDYIRRLRLERSARLLHSVKELSVTDIALSCGFSTPALFSRNFKKHFGISPLEWKKSKNRQIKSKNRNAKIGTSNYNSNRIYKGKPEVEVLKMEAFKIAYIRHLKGYNRQIIEAYNKLFAWAVPRGLVNEDTRLISILLDNPEITPGNKCRYYAGIQVESDVGTSKEVSIMEIPAGIYAVSKFSGDEKTIDDFFNKFYHEWLINSGYTADDFPIYIVMPLGKKYSGTSFKFDSYIKIRPL